MDPTNNFIWSDFSYQAIAASRTKQVVAIFSALILIAIIVLGSFLIKNSKLFFDESLRYRANVKIISFTMTSVCGLLFVAKSLHLIYQKLTHTDEVTVIPKPAQEQQFGEPIGEPFNREEHQLDLLRKGYAGLTFYPCKTEWEILPQLIVQFQLNPVTGDMTITIPNTEKQICLHIKDVGKIYSSLEQEIQVTITPPSFDTLVEVFEYTDSWKPVGSYDFHTNKLKPTPKIVPKNKRGAEINKLAIAKSTQRLPVSNIAQSWIGKGHYVYERRLSIGATRDSFGFEEKRIQDVKVLALHASEGRHAELATASQNRVSAKTAALNCWQFCLLSYVEAGILSWGLIGNVYSRLERLDPKEWDMLDAIKYGKRAEINFTALDTTPKAGDILCFSNQINNNCHCAILQEVDLVTGEYSFVEILGLGDVVRIRKKNIVDNEMVTFVREEDVQENLLNFLAH